jgi:hypothetical protein
MTLKTCLFVSFLALPIPAAASEIHKLSGLAGSGAGEKDGVRLEEHWTAPSGATMIGMHRDIRGGRTVSFEFFRVVEDSLGLVYMAQPGGRAPATPFRAKSLESRRVVFENLEHDFPQRVIYWMGKDGALQARVEGTIGGKLESEEWRWEAARLK